MSASRYGGSADFGSAGSDPSPGSARSRRLAAEGHRPVRRPSAISAERDPRAAWDHWRATRDDLFRDASTIAGTGRVTAVVPRPLLARTIRPSAFEGGSCQPVGRSGGSPGSVPALALPCQHRRRAVLRAGSLTFVLPLPVGARSLTLYWMAGYAGGLFLPFRDTTNGIKTYGAGRYLLDTAKSADLGGQPADRDA